MTTPTPTTHLGLGIQEIGECAQRAIPDRVQQRRGELRQARLGRLNEICLHEETLMACRSEIAAIDSEFAGIDLAVSAYGGTEAAPAARAARVARRDIRAMVLEAVKNAPLGASVAALASGLETRPAPVRSALEHWQARGEVTMRNDVARAAGAAEPALNEAA